MPITTRRVALKGALAGLGATQLGAAVAARGPLEFGRGFEGQRKADLGNGTFLNPIVPGDHPDPTILKDGADYYMTFSSFLSYPGVILWHSRDLVSWRPLGPALTQPIGNVWAMDLVKHAGRYYIYIPASSEKGSSIYLTPSRRLKARDSYRVFRQHRVAPEALRRVPAAGDLHRSLHRRNGRVPP
jgi:xylan 1,4-beta-xylosidase